MVNDYEKLIERSIHPLESDEYGEFPIPKHHKKFPEDKQSCRCSDFKCCFFKRPPVGYVEEHSEKFFVDLRDRSRIKMNKNWIRIYEIDGEKHVMYACPFLDDEGYCSEYEKRPKICREYGSSLKCNLDKAKLVYERKNGHVTIY